MRKLITSDIFAACRMLKRIGVKEEVKKIAADKDSFVESFDAGFELIWNIFDAATEKKRGNVYL